MSEPQVGTQEAAARTDTNSALVTTPAANYDPALLGAWQRFLDYDYASSLQKQLHQRIRLAIIVLALMTSIGAILSVYALGVPQLSGILPSLLRVALIIMPIASVALMNYAAQFATSTGWVEYRVSAELIRTQIYLYRLHVEPYQKATPQENQLELL